MAGQPIPLAPPPPGAPPPPPAGAGAGNPPPPPRPNQPPVPPAPPCQAPDRGDQNQWGVPWLLGVVALAFFLLCWAFWPGGRPAGPSDPPAKQAANVTKSGPKKRSGPDHTGALATSVRDLDYKVESLAAEVKDLGGRVGELEKQLTSPTVDQVNQLGEDHLITEDDLRELDERYFDALRRRRLPE